MGTPMHAAGGQARRSPQVWPWALALVLPLAGLALVVARPELDLTWEHHPAHFWLVLGVAFVNVALAFLTSEAASRRADARLLLVSLAFLASAGFLGLHALATPGVLLPRSNVGFVIATPLGLSLAGVLAAASALPLAGPRAAWVLRRQAVLRGATIVLLAAWGVASALGLPPLSSAMPPEEATAPLRVVAVPAISLYAFGAWRYLALYRQRGRAVSLAVAVALALLAEAMAAVVLSRNWRISWWEWHVLMAVAFGVIAVAIWNEYRRERSLTGAFGGIYLDATLQRLDRWHAAAVADLAAADPRGEPQDEALERLRGEGASSEELSLLSHAAAELRRTDELFRPYLPAQLADELRREPAMARLGGEEREISVMFADLAGFTTFSESHRPREVIHMLNRFWEAAVPIIDRHGGLIEQFAGDAVMAVWNAVVPTPDHARRAAGAALEMVDAAGRIAAREAGWPLFRIGISSGPAVVGNVGAARQRSFAAIGDTTNLAQRLMSAAKPGQVIVAGATWERLAPAARGERLGPLQLKGKREPQEAWRLQAMDGTA